MILRGVGTRILVRDFQKCFDFYTQIIGFKVIWGDRQGPYVSFSEADKEEVAFSIYLYDGMDKYSDYIPLSGDGSSDKIVLCMGAESVDEIYKELKAKGVEFMGEPRDIPYWGMRCVYFRDPEDNLVEIAGKMLNK